MQLFNRGLLVLVFDLLALVLAWCGSFWLRFNFSWPEGYELTIVFGLACILPAHAMACWQAGLYRGLWIFASLPDLKRVFKAVGGSLLAMVIYAMLVTPQPAVPRSFLVLFPLLLACLMGGGRIAYRMWKEYQMFGAMTGQGKPVVLIGAGRTGALLVRDMERSRDWRGWSVFSTMTPKSGGGN
ncbi:MAG: hypothetical protein U5M23_13270 [Marinagarivorans sp.]|nr:hypothetical protein [Marinagarivorans sp.]